MTRKDYTATVETVLAALVLLAVLAIYVYFQTKEAC